eukprot:c20035_g1_i1 orf=1089-1784(-)
MAKEGSEVDAAPNDLKDAKLISEKDLKSVQITFEQDVKDMKSLSDTDLHDVKHLKDTKRSMEPEDCGAAQVHVLAVDDSFVDRKIIERLVKGASFSVIAVDSGAKALEVLASVNNNINLIITDYCMPEMSGYDLLRRVKETPAMKDIPVVIMSSENVPSRIQRCLEEGAEEFMLKPVRLADVKRLKAYVYPPKENPMEQRSAPCKKRKFGSEGFQVQSPERGPRIGSVTVA